MAIDWTALRAPFPVHDLRFRIQQVYEKKDGNTDALMVVYVDAVAIEMRLDEAVGPENWSFDWEPIVVADKTLLVAKGVLSIAGIAKADVGDASESEKTKGTVSDAFKRAARKWGIGGRVLNRLPKLYAKVVNLGTENKPRWELAKGQDAVLRKKVAGFLGMEYAPASTEHGTQEQTDAQEHKQQTTPERMWTSEQRQSIQSAVRFLPDEVFPAQALTYGQAEREIKRLRDKYVQQQQVKGAAS